MRSWIARPLVCCALVAAFAGCGGSGGDATPVITFDVTVPEGTAGKVYVTGSITELGEWQAPGALPLRDAGGDRWTGTVDVGAQPVGTVVYYKFTRGTWETVEKGDGCVELPNRELTIGGPKTAAVHSIAMWSDSCP